MMIVKKIPILQGFPALETVKYLSNTKNELSEYNPIFTILRQLDYQDILHLCI